jgi:uncharacterized protein (TIGR03067 family)
MKTFTSVCLTLLAVSAVCAEAEKGGKVDPAKLAGKWKIVSGVRMGEKVPKERLSGSVEITKDTITLEDETGKFVIPYKVMAKTSPAGIDMQIKSGPAGVGTRAKGIVALEKGKLRLCYIPGGEKRPKKFESTKANGAFLFVLERAK